MNTHQVILNGQAVGVARDHFKLLTLVHSTEHHDADGNRFTIHELRISGFDAAGKVGTEFVPPITLKKGDVVQILIGEAHDA